MKLSIGTKILSIIFLILFHLPGISFSEGEWTEQNGNIFNTHSANVGIGTTNPGYKLDIENSGAFAVELRDSSGEGTSGFIGVDSGSKKMFLGGTTVGASNIVLDRSGNGNVGIGTTSPSRKLHIVSGTAYDYPLLLQAPTTPAIQFIDNAAGTVGYIGGGANGFLTGGGGNGLTIRSEGYGIYFGANRSSSTHMAILSSGNVGIGTTNPTVALDVVGTIRANGRIQVNTNDIGFLATIDNPIAPPNTAQTLISTLKKNTLENGDHNQLRLGFYANDDGGGSPDKRFFTSIEAVVENPNSSTREAGLRFLTNKAGAELERMRINGNGNVGIGTTSPQSKLAVKGTIMAMEIKVTDTNWSDFVFEDTYELPSLNLVESYIKKNKHLPNIPSAKEIEEQGLAVSEMLAKQMQKIEEMTLYLIQLKQENDHLKERVAMLERSN